MDDDDANGMDFDLGRSLLPYERWTQDALRGVVARALSFAAKNGLPGDHHFYVTFLTRHPGVTVPARLRAQYKQEMTVVLQHQFWDLAVDEAAGQFSVGLSFGGVASTLVVPLAAIVAFADPHVQLSLRFSPPPDPTEETVPAPVPAADAVRTGEEDVPTPTEVPQVVSLDAFRRRPAPKEQE